MHAHAHTHTHTHKHTHNLCTHAHTNTNTHKNMYKHTHKLHTLTQRHTHTHGHTQARTHTHFSPLMCTERHSVFPRLPGRGCDWLQPLQVNSPPFPPKVLLPGWTSDSHYWISGGTASLRVTSRGSLPALLESGWGLCTAAEEGNNKRSLIGLGLIR